MLLAVLALALASGGGGAQSREPGFGVETVAPKGGWYTEAQAERGSEAYTLHCVRCHGVELEGVIGFSPQLSGPSFLNRWGEQPIERLFHYTSALMPLDMPGILTRGTYADILAYIVQENGFPPGREELRPDRHQMGRTILPAEPPEEPGSATGDEGTP